MWQLLWSWVFGPFVLFKIHRINDIHYWRLQTTMAVIARYANGLGLDAMFSHVYVALVFQELHYGSWPYIPTSLPL